MKVVELKTVDGRIRYYLDDDTGAAVQPVLKYLKFKDNAGYARNTLRMHCIHLKHFFTYIKRVSMGMNEIKARKEVSKLLGHERDDVTRIYMAGIERG